MLTPIGSKPLRPRGWATRITAHRAGTRELLLVLSGTVELQVGDTEQRLMAGDSASFDGTTPHAYRNASATRPARFTLAVFEPNLSKEHG